MISRVPSFFHHYCITHCPCLVHHYWICTAHSSLARNSVYFKCIFHAVRMCHCQWVTQESGPGWRVETRSAPIATSCVGPFGSQAPRTSLTICSHWSSSLAPSIAYTTKRVKSWKQTCTYISIVISPGMAERGSRARNITIKGGVVSLSLVCFCDLTFFQTLNFRFKRDVNAGSRSNTTSSFP